MEVTNEAAALLSNYEVYQFLKDVQAGKGHRKPNKHQGSLGTVLYETVKYLDTTTCPLQDPETVKAFMLALKPYKLTKAEKLQLLNHCPTTTAEIIVIVEESEERLSVEQIDEILNIVSAHFPMPTPEAEENGEEEEMEEEDNGEEEGEEEEEEAEEEEEEEEVEEEPAVEEEGEEDVDDDS